ncbi:peptidyl-prolyl cis-trans isomerase C [Deinococcus sp. HSC-46F16]|uniref:peptidylprolyl isomerase n=1 Tax=Deinococcus sp. HSC-46F16 TaxID=2910968 RepID=UPI00209F56E4|nr:peptidylprolyl isomerase [Deinococcus sp. HSC-46F16]MCP2013331.1 peptidyl-prolyl cis-trans isomerase C [Deinococcus sp. HSC-46F16]
MQKSLLTLALLLGGAALAQTTGTPTTPAAPATQTQPTPAAPAQTPAAPATTAPAQTPADPQTVVARVGSETITLGEYERAFRLAVARVLNSQGIPFSDDALAQFAEARTEFLTQYARDRAVYQLARRGTAVTAAQVDAQLAETRQGFGTDADFAEALAANGFANEAELRADIERELIVDAYLEGIKSRLKFGDALVASFYNLNRSAFTRPAQACVRHILVATQAEGQTILRDLAAGGDFAAIAREKSQDPGSAAEGGELGCIEPSETVEPFDRTSFAAPLNQPQLVQSEYGWHVLVVTRRTQAGVAPLAEVAPVIREQLARDAAQKYLDSQLARVTISTTPAALPAPVPASTR